MWEPATERRRNAPKRGGGGLWKDYRVTIGLNNLLIVCTITQVSVKSLNLARVSLSNPRIGGCHGCGVLRVI